MPAITKGGPTMLTIQGQSNRYCDGLSRRSFLRIGALSLGAVGGLSLTDILRAETRAGMSGSSPINVSLRAGTPFSIAFHSRSMKSALLAIVPSSFRR